MESRQNVGHHSSLTARLLRADEVAEILGGISRATLHRMAQRGVVPYYRIGRTGIRFDLAEVLEALRRPARTMGEEAR